LFCSWVERTRCFVQEKDSRIRNYAAGNSDSLSLPTREQSSTLTDFSEVAVWELLDEIVSITGYACLADKYHLFIFRQRYPPVVNQPVQHIMKYGSSKQGRFLLDQPNPIAEPSRVILTDIDVVKQDLPGNRLIPLLIPYD
jgi:hypothetical protein